MQLLLVVIALLVIIITRLQIFNQEVRVFQPTGYGGSVAVKIQRPVAAPCVSGGLFYKLQ